MDYKYKIRRWLKIIVIMILAFVTGISLGVAAIYFGYKSAAVQSTPKKEAVNTSSTSPNTIDKRINILLLGLDDGDPDNPDSPRRSDTMLVASIDPGKGTVNLLSVPRDTKVNIPGHTGYDKITHAFFYGGADLSVKTVEKFLNIKIDHYVVIDWQAFIKVVDILGGVDINVEHDMNYDDPYENLYIHLNKGQQHLNGEKAGEYVRFRHDELGDIGRVERQQQFLKVLTNQMLQTGTITKLPSMISVINQYVKTDMDTVTMLKLANSLKNLNANSLYTDMVPGDFATIDGLSYWEPDIQKMNELTHKMFN